MKTPKEHKIWYAFCEHFKKWYHDDGGNFTSIDMIGFKAMCRVEKYAKNHPEIKIVQCDDYVFASSLIILVPHPKMGITFIFIPQCTTIQGELFLRPENINRLIDNLITLRSITGKA